MILIVPLLGVSAIALTFVAGLAFSPFAAASCAVLAKRRNLSVKRYALAGGIYSALLIAPYVYLVVRLLDRKPPEELVRWAYYILVTVWLAGPIFASVGFAAYTAAEGNPWEPAPVPIIVFNGIAAAVNVGMLVPWLFWHKLRKPAPESDDLLPRVGYVLPFLMAPLGLFFLYAMNMAIEPFSAP